MDAKVRAMMWSELRKVNVIAHTYMTDLSPDSGVRSLALGLLRVGYLLEALLSEHGPEIDLLGRVIVRDERGKVVERVEGQKGDDEQG